VVKIPLALPEWSPALGGFSSASITLSVTEFDVVWEAQGFTGRHPALWTRSEGATHTERRRIVQEVWSSLRSRGLADHDRVSDDLLDKLTLIAQPKFRYDFWIWADEETRGCVAGNDSQGVLIEVGQDEIVITSVDKDSLAEAAVSIADEVPPGHGYTVNVRYDAVKNLDFSADSQSMVVALSDSGIPWGRAHELVRVLTGAKVRGQFGAELTARDFRVHRAERIIDFCDLEDGRYLVLVERNNDGEEWLTVTPATKQLLATRLGELLQGIRF
jgi:hypothetical protein